MTPIESRVLTLERRVGRVGADLGDARRELAAVLQQLKLLDGVGLFGGACLVTIAVTVTGAGGAAVAGAAVTVKTSGGVVAGTATTDGSGGATVVLAFTDSFVVEVAATGYLASTTSIGSVACGSTATVPVALTAGVYSPYCGITLATSYTLHDDQTPNHTTTVTWDGSAYWVGCWTQGGGGGACPGIPKIGMFWYVDLNFNLFLQYKSATSNGCPQFSDCTSTPTTTGLWDGGSSSSLSPQTVACSPLAVTWGGASSFQTPYNGVYGYTPGFYAYRYTMS